MITWGQQFVASGLAAQIPITGATVSYAAAMIYGKRFAEIAPETTAVCILGLAAAVLVPVSFAVEAPLALHSTFASSLAVLALAVFCTAGAFALYFRLVNTLGSAGTSSVAHSRAAISVMTGVLLLGESFGSATAISMVAVLVGVMAINGQLYTLFRRKPQSPA
jgi:drug/metabolite transporter (DMT)-like permease